MAGYHGYSKSNNAIEAEECGRMTASTLAKRLKCSAKAVSELLEPSEWHHTSKHFNKTNYYDESLLVAVAAGDEETISEYDDDEIATAKETFAKLKAFDAERKAAEVKVYNNCKVEWLEWGGTRKRPKAFEKSADGVTVEDKGKDFLSLTLPDGSVMRKSKTTRGFCVRWEGIRITN